jgi:hypothetical protein
MQFVLICFSCGGCRLVIDGIDRGGIAEVSFVSPLEDAVHHGSRVTGACAVVILRRQFVVVGVAYGHSCVGCAHFVSLAAVI